MPLIDTTPRATTMAVVHVELPEHAKDLLRDEDTRLQEAVGLALSLEGVQILHTSIIDLKDPSPRTLLKSGKVEELGIVFDAAKIDVVVLNCHVSPSQQRNLELEWKRKVIDRTGLILEIFARRARTKAGQLQVELARAMYQQSRLVRLWTHLERQRGGLGKTGGPGERQIELDRRKLRDQISGIKEELEDVERERALQRKARARAGMPVIALVGYTNAGKSTLFNALVGDEALAKDQLFATLDPLMRKAKLPSGREVIFSDTVGFVSDLPHQLVEAFHATLEEVCLADVLLHVHDAASDDAKAQHQDVLDVLSKIGAAEVPVIDVNNKVDLLPEGNISEVHGIPVSGLKATGLGALYDAIEERLSARERVYEFDVPAADGRRIAWLHAHGQILNEMQLLEDNSTYRITVKLAPEEAEAFRKLL